MGAAYLGPRMICGRQLIRTLTAMILALAPVLAFGATSESQTPPKYDDVNTPEGWAWSQIKQGLPADFGEHCGVKLNPRAQDDARWRDGPCRTIRASFIVDLLTKSALHDTIPFEGIALYDAKIVGDVDLGFATIDRPLRIELSRFEGAVRLDYAHADGLVDFEGSVFTGPLQAIAFRSESDLLLSGAMIFGKASLSGAKMKGLVAMTGTNFKNDLEADALEVGGSLMMNSRGPDKATFKNVSMTRAKVAGQVTMVGASFDGFLNAEGVRVGESLLMYSDARNRATFQAVSFLDGQVASNVELIGATVAGPLMAGSLRVGGSLNMQSEGANEASFKGIYLVGAKVARDFNLYGARVDGELLAESVQIGGSLITNPIPPYGTMYRTRLKGVDLELSTVDRQINMQDTTLDGDITLEHMHVIGDVLLINVNSDRLLKLSYAQIGGNVDFSGAELDKVDLGGASIAGEMRIGNENSAVTWISDKNGGLNLRGAHVSRLSDSEKSWPKRLFLEGFSFEYFGENSGAQMMGRGADWWNRNFVELDPQRSTSPYEQLAAVFAAAGHREAVDEIHYDERAWADQKNSGLAFVWSNVLRLGAGYGIGTYMFRALYWAVGLSLLGAVFLRFCANKGVIELKHGCVWCFGASVNRLLPVLSLKKEFVDFFDNPKLNQFAPWQDLLFVVFGMLGWVLGVVVIAAFATITHGP